MHVNNREGFMKQNILIALGVILLASMWIQFAHQNTNDRYAVITGSNMMTILLDKKTGVTWRNCICNEKTNIPGCWERMNTINPEKYSKPIGEVTINKKLQADIKKQEKLQKKMDENKQNPPSQGQPEPIRIGQ